ncbi:MAG: hypothetical protein U1E26_08510 [Coriobacteriia bacterium]|nr:hypothetical protein [Coriobacteriia bacterium]
MNRLQFASRCALVLVLGIAGGLLAAPDRASAGITTMVSVYRAGYVGNQGGGSREPAISADGRWVAFVSENPNLVLGDTGDTRDVFLRDRLNGVTTRISSANAEMDASDPSVSSDGRYVAYETHDADTKNADILVFDRLTGVTTLANLNSAGLRAVGASTPSISADGRYVAFETWSMPIGTDPEELSGGNLWVRDRIAGTTTLVSVDSQLGPGADEIYPGHGSDPEISGDGRYVVYRSDDNLVVANDTNGNDDDDAGTDVFVRDLVAGTTTRVSVNSAGGQAIDPYCQAPSISADGRYVAFTSEASNLVANDTNACSDVFVHDRVTGATTRVSLTSSGAQAPQGGGGNSLSSTGRFVAFGAADGLVAADTNGEADCYVRDCVTGALMRVSVSSSGAQAPPDSGDASSEAVISANGMVVAFQGSYDRFVSVDENRAPDIFAHELNWSGAPLATSITIKTTATTARIGNAPTLSGAVTPTSLIGKSIVVYVKKPGKRTWTYLAKGTVYRLPNGSAAWRYKYYFKPGMVKGVYTYKAVVPALPGFKTSTSPRTVSIRLR